MKKESRSFYYLIFSKTVVEIEREFFFNELVRLSKLR